MFVLLQCKGIELLSKVSNLSLISNIFFGFEYFAFIQWGDVIRFWSIALAPSWLTGCLVRNIIYCLCFFRLRKTFKSFLLVLKIIPERERNLVLLVKIPFLIFQKTPLSAAERAKRYRKKNKHVVGKRYNLNRKIQRLTTKVIDLIKNAERLKISDLPKLHTVEKREEMKLLYHNNLSRLQRKLNNIQQRNLHILHRLHSHRAVQGTGIEMLS